MGEIKFRRGAFDPEFEGSEEDAYLALRALVQDTMQTLDGEQLVDTLLMFANVCEYRGMNNPHSSLALWYAQLSVALRNILALMTNFTEHAPLPNAALDDYTLYWSTPSQTH